MPGRGLRRAQAGEAPAGVPVTVDPKALLRILHSESGVNTLINLKLDGARVAVLVKEYQLDPVTQRAAARRLLPAGDGQGHRR